MAFETAAGLATFDLASGSVVPSVTPGLYDLIYKDRDRAFLSRIADGPAIPNVQFSWWERALRPMIVQTNEGATFTAGDVTLTVAAANADRIVVGAVLADEASLGGERMIVTAISGNDLTVVRGYGGTTATTHADQFKARIVALPAQENSTSGLDLLRAPSEIKNYTQIVRRDLKSSRSSQGVQTYPGYHLDAKRLQEKLEEIRDEMEQFSLFGVPAASSPAGSDTVLRTTGGFLNFVDKAGANVDSTAYTGQTSQDLKDKIDSAAKFLVENGGDPNFVLAGSTIFGGIMDLDSDKVRFEVNDGVRGSVVTAIRSKYGPVLDLVMDRWFASKFLCVGDYRKNSLRIFANDGMPHIEELAKTSDGKNFMVIGELGFEFVNGPDANYLYKDIVLA